MRPHIIVDPALSFGAPVLPNGTPVDVVCALVWAGEMPEVICDDYDITREELIVACWHQATRGTNRWRTRWGTWADAAFEYLFTGAYDKIPHPPTRKRGDR